MSYLYLAVEVVHHLKNLKMFELLLSYLVILAKYYIFNLYILMQINKNPLFVVLFEYVYIKKAFWKIILPSLTPLTALSDDVIAIHQSAHKGWN